MGLDFFFFFKLSLTFYHLHTPPRPLYAPVSARPKHISHPLHEKTKLNEKHHSPGRFLGCLLWPLKWCRAVNEKRVCGLLCSCLPGLGRAVSREGRPLDWVAFQSIGVSARYLPTKHVVSCTHRLCCFVSLWILVLLKLP